MNWSQLRTVLWLRWRLTRNQLTRGSPVNAAFTILFAVLGLVIAVAGGIGGALGGALGLAKASPQVMLQVWDGIVGVFLFVWLLGLVTEIQRSETIDLARLLHLPVSLKQIFLVNYLASHLSLPLILFLPAVLGLCAGLVWGRGGSMTLLFPLTLSFLFMVTAWTYCLRGWLIALMVNQRRRRAIIAGVTMTAILLGQLPNLYFNVMGRGGWGRPRAKLSPSQSRDEKPGLPPVFLSAHKFIPPLWVANGAAALSAGDPWPAVGGSLGAFALGALGLMRAYRSTLRFYQGGKTRNAPPVSRPPAPAKPHRQAAGGPSFLERKLPGVPEEAAALALAFFRSLTRAPEVKMLLAANVLMPLIFGAMFFSRGLKAPGAAKPFLATAAVAFTFLTLAQPMFNQFGLDREGFRALVLLPTRRRHILLAKNLSLLPIGGGLGLIFLALVAVALRLPPLAVLAACAQLGSTFLLLSLAGNFISVLAPYRIAAGSLKPTKAPAKMMALIFVSHLLFPIAMAPIFIPPALGLLSASLGWLPSGPVNLLLSLLWLVVIAFLYRLSLENLGQLLQRREQKILQAVTQEVE